MLPTPDRRAAAPHLSFQRFREGSRFQIDTREKRQFVGRLGNGNGNGSEGTRHAIEDLPKRDGVRGRRPSGRRRWWRWRRWSRWERAREAVVPKERRKAEDANGHSSPTHDDGRALVMQGTQRGGGPPGKARPDYILFGQLRWIHFPYTDSTPCHILKTSDLWKMESGTSHRSRPTSADPGRWLLQESLAQCRSIYTCNRGNAIKKTDRRTNVMRHNEQST